MGHGLQMDGGDITLYSTQQLIKEMATWWMGGRTNCIVRNTAKNSGSYNPVIDATTTNGDYSLGTLDNTFFVNYCSDSDFSQQNNITNTLGINLSGTDCNFDTTRNNFTFNKPLYMNGEYIPTLTGYIPSVDGGSSGVFDIGYCRVCFGKVAINPTANQPTGVWVNFPASFVRNPVVMATPNTAVPYTTVRGCGVSDVGTTGMNVYVTRTNTTQTLIYWVAIGPKW